MAAPRKKSAKKENQFIIRNGSRLHAYGRDKAPYPLSYDRDVFDIQCMDHLLMFKAKQTVSFIDFKGNTPKRCLDLGTGLGDWIIEAAKFWPDCSFVGYDLVNVQLPLSLFKEFDPDLPSRIEWVHGNLLRQKLPFDDDEFDYVHIQGLAFAVPESKWPSVYEEINRVLRPGGAIEQIEEDAIFPTVPRWFTAPLHAQVKRPSAHFPDGTQRSLLPIPTVSTAHSHDHALLEFLFMSVFENRFLNRTPSSVLPGYFSAIFRHVLMPPVLNFPMPPLAPLPPLPNELGSPSTVSSDLSDTTTLYLPDFELDSLQSPPSSERSPVSIIDASTTDVQPFSLEEVLPSTDYGRNRSSSTSTGSTLADPPTGPVLPKPPVSAQRRSVAFSSPEMSTRIGDDTVLNLFPIDELTSLEEHALSMQLYRAVGSVLAVKEAMWEELMEQMKDNKDRLRGYGWENDDEQSVNRQKFDSLVERYKGDMHVRISLWHSATKYGWQYPRRDPLSKGELVEEERMRRAIMEARKCATEADFQTPSRSLRLLVGDHIVVRHRDTILTCSRTLHSHCLHCYFCTTCMTITLYAL
ncbi:unnamed protein product [Somion occarium]|uniref:Methyltransferase domain-containing protein n=1 Tax=Somion occarium TaxID=3059160 RepID=A0ABP1CHC1_9APHY